LWRNLTATVATVLEALGLDAEAAPMMQRQANNRADEWVERYRREAPLLGLAS
jgi:LPS sulfotransferase NodH